MCENSPSGSPMTIVMSEDVESDEVAPETILAEVAHVIPMAIPQLRLTPYLGAPEPIGAIFDVERVDRR
jgi:hypothetical protein